MKRIIFAVAAAAAMVFAFAVVPASATPTTQVCDGQNFLCLDRAGQGTQFGTWVIAWGQGPDNNDFTFAIDSISWCGNSNWVHNGENGLTCPFAVGSGLNQRYDHKYIYDLPAYNETNTCSAIPDFSNTAVDLEACGSQGSFWVVSPASGGSNAWVINVGESNYAYQHGGTYDTPYWLWYNSTVGQGARLLAQPSSQFTWGCVGGHIDSC